MDVYNGLGTIRNIPLICTVCPETPRFSDVSHLLTHIASKGHLHHETQTKLRAHQDLVAAVALQQYEQWYAQNGIESLLVERLKAKQLKEAMKSRLHRANVTNKPVNTASRVSQSNLDAKGSLTLLPDQKETQADCERLQRIRYSRLHRGYSNIPWLIFRGKRLRTTRRAAAE